MGYVMQHQALPELSKMSLIVCGTIVYEAAKLLAIPVSVTTFTEIICKGLSKLRAKHMTSYS